MRWCKANNAVQEKVWLCENLFRRMQIHVLEDEVKARWRLRVFLPMLGMIRVVDEQGLVGETAGSCLQCGNLIEEVPLRFDREIVTVRQP